MKRLTVEEVVTAFKETGLRPQQGTYLDKFNEGKATCGCGLGAVFAHTEGIFSEDEACDADKELSNYFDDMFGYLYRIGFVHGFDGEKPSSLYPNKGEGVRYFEGYEDGKNAYEAVTKEEN